MLVSGDNRQQSDPDALRFCGPGALTMEQKENYATLMRIAMLSSMQARYTSATMGFRCATESHAMRALLLALLLTVAPLAGADAGYPPQSIYNLNAKLVDQSGAARGLDMHRGHPVLVTMFYGSCPLACPLLIDTLRAFERSLTPAERARIRVVLISIDPEHDTTESLQALATTRRSRSVALDSRAYG